MTAFSRLAILILSMFVAVSCHAQTAPEDAILGNWLTEQNTLKIYVYKEKGDFRARITWFRDHDDVKRPMATRMDDKNPNPAMHHRKIIGMDVLRNMRYKPKDKRWEHGLIYDATSGKEWDSSAWITKDGSLKVRGFWKFEFFGKTLTFKRVAA